MLRTYRFRIYPTKREKKELNVQMLLARELYNLLLEKAKTHYKENSKLFTRNMMNLWITELKRERAEFNCMYSQVMQNIADRVSKAYKSFFRRADERKSGRKIKVGFPRPKKFVQSITYPQFGFEITKEAKRIVVSNIGSIPAVFDRDIEGKTKTLTIKKSRSGDWHAFTIASIADKEFVSNGKKEAGLDLGLKSYATLSDGNKFRNLRPQEAVLRRLKRLQRKLSRKKSGGRNRVRSAIRLTKLSGKIVRRREDYLHKLSYYLVNSYSFIGYEKLDIKSMLKKHNLARNITDASWGSFVNMLCYKAESAGCRVVGTDPRDTSKTCSMCGAIKEMPLSERRYVCMSCGIETDRDINAAVNILRVCL